MRRSSGGWGGGGWSERLALWGLNLRCARILLVRTTREHSGEVRGGMWWRGSYVLAVERYGLRGLRSAGQQRSRQFTVVPTSPVDRFTALSRIARQPMMSHHRRLTSPHVASPRLGRVWCGAMTSIDRLRPLRLLRQRAVKDETKECHTNDHDNNQQKGRNNAGNG
jgi:hypothetical protein